MIDARLHVLCAFQNVSKCSNVDYFLQMIAKSAIFQNVAQRMRKFALSFAKIAQKFCEWKPYASNSPTLSCSHPVFVLTMMMQPEFLPQNVYTIEQ